MGRFAECYPYWIAVQADNLAMVVDLDGVPAGCSNLDEALDRIVESVARGPNWRRIYQILGRDGEVLDTVDAREPQEARA